MKTRLKYRWEIEKLRRSRKRGQQESESAGQSRIETLPEENRLRSDGESGWVRNTSVGGRAWWNHQTGGVAGDQQTTTLCRWRAIGRVWWSGLPLLLLLLTQQDTWPKWSGFYKKRRKKCGMAVEELVTGVYWLLFGQVQLILPSFLLFLLIKISTFTVCNLWWDFNFSRPWFPLCLLQIG